MPTSKNSVNTCIYRKTGEPSLHFTSREHVFPAGIGGNTTLQVGVVSDEANETFSPIELNFMRHSIISVFRQFAGPGKRGSLGPERATQSEVQVMHSVDLGDKPVLAYASLGVPHVIPQVEIASQDAFHVRLDASVSGDYWPAATAFVQDVRN